MLRNIEILQQKIDPEKTKAWENMAGKVYVYLALYHESATFFGQFIPSELVRDNYTEEETECSFNMEMQL